MATLPDSFRPHQPLVPRPPLLQVEPVAGVVPAESTQLFDWALIGSYATFVLHSIGRHKWLFAAVWFGIIGLSVALMKSMPKTYRVQATLQAQRNTVMPALSNPGRAIPSDADTPTRQAAETVQRYDNIVTLIQQTDLLREWPLRRAPLLRVKDYIWRKLFPAPTRDEQIVGFAYYLRDKLWVATGEGTVTIGVEFPDGELAYRLVDAAVENFLEARHAADVSSISEAITILEARAEQARQALEGSVQQLQAMREEHGGRPAKRARKPAPEVRAPAVPDQEASRLVVAAQSKRRAIADLEEFRRRRVTELQTKLQEQRAIYSENHPIVVDIQQSLAAVQKESPQVAALKAELAGLESELKTKGIAGDAAEIRGPTRVAIPSERLDARAEDDPQTEYLREQINFALSKYNSFLDRIEGARLELDSARAAFKYRYSIVLPAQRPRYANKPNPTLVLGASLVAGFALALLSTALVDLRSRKLLESWQVERALKIPLIAEVRSQ
jgi:uncharacterized protein involved in exopolysaccharide biosynthesis